jgi:phosphopantothenoylcysteine decarboxylase / phosphopantothenate---cysteine ligase
MNPLFEGKRILLGISGSIAAYKAVYLASSLTKSGAEVDVILTKAAQEFITPLAFQSVTGRRAFVDQDLWSSQGHVLHIGLAKAADIYVIAPITANTIAKLAHGFGDNLLTLTALAANCPVLIAPAMDGGMYLHSATQKNLEILYDRCVIIVGPAEGHLASGLNGVGRMLEPEEIFGYIRQTLAKGGSLCGKKVIITAGGTQERIDPVRVITNRSSGKQGFALAQAALDLGAEVELISAPVHLDTPMGAKRINVETAQEMLETVKNSISNADVLIMAAAVADFRPKSPAQEKIKKLNGIPTIQLETTPDILNTVVELKREKKWSLITVGFAAESQRLLENARHKLETKTLDMIVANDISIKDSGFNVDTNRVTIINADGSAEPLPLLRKDQVAFEIIKRISSLLSNREISN